MTMPKFAAKRDNNESDIVKDAAKLGWRLWKLNEPCDWLGLNSGVWFPIEIKNPDKEGHADEFTAQQKIFHKDLANCGGECLVWRTIDDMLTDTRRIRMRAR